MQNLDVAHPDLIADIRAFCDRHGMALTRFGKEAVNDPSFLRQLEEGRECRRSTIAKVRQFMASSDEPVRAAE